MNLTVDGVQQVEAAKAYLCSTDHSAAHDLHVDQAIAQALAEPQLDKLCVIAASSCRFRAMHNFRRDP